MNDLIILTPRLQTVADLVPDGCRLADIGTDHAYLPVYLLQMQRISYAIAGDVRKGPLDHARQTAQRFQMTERMSFRLSDGLKELAPNEADCITICGMGGEAIRCILSNAPWTKNNTRLILQPQTNQSELRSWLTNHGYRILQEHLVREEERWYTILLVVGGEETITWTPGSLMAGHPHHWIAQHERVQYLRFLLSRTEKQISGLSKASDPDQERLDWLKSARNELIGFLSVVSAE